MIQQTQQQRQVLKFTPQQIQMLNLLLLTSFELEQKIKDEIEENPALETSEFEEGETEDSNSDEMDIETSDLGEALPQDFLPEYDDDVPNYKERSEVDYSAQEFYESPVVSVDSFHDRIKAQINLLPISDEEMEKTHFVIDSLDDDGFLREDLDELAYQYAFSNGTSCEKEDLLKVLGYIQDCEPAGIGARNLQECLLLQLDREKKHEPMYKTARLILSNHCFELENRNFEKIQRGLSLSPEELKKAIHLIGKLNPKPNIYIESSINTNQVIPEYSIRNEGGVLSVSLINKNLPELKLNESVVQLVENAPLMAPVTKRKNKAAVTFYKNKLSSAQWFIDAIKQREESMMQVMKAIVRFQYEFFQTGDYKLLRPMVLRNVAEMVGLDISTISRVTSTKYVQTDFGTVHLKELFTEAMSKENGDVVSNKEIQDIIKEMLVKENKAQPLTDQEISEVLKEEGYKVARRTVAKYRECIGLPIAKMRRSMA
jgi:RNA polymerase sigma-54 factor